MLLHIIEASHLELYLQELLPDAFNIPVNTNGIQVCCTGLFQLLQLHVNIAPHRMRFDLSGIFLNEKVCQAGQRLSRDRMFSIPHSSIKHSGFRVDIELITEKSLLE